LLDNLAKKSVHFWCYVAMSTSRGPFLTSPLEANFDPRGEVSPQGAKLTPGVEVIPWGEILCLPLHSAKQYRVFVPGGEQRGEHSPWGTNFTPGGQGWS
jgi:hypothetical protein